MNKQIIAKQLIKIAKELVGQNKDNVREEFEKLLDWAKRNFDETKKINDDRFIFYKTYKKNNKIIGLKLELEFDPEEQFYFCSTYVYDNKEGRKEWNCRFSNYLMYKSYDAGIKIIKNNLEQSVKQYIEILDKTKKSMNEKLQNNREYIEKLQEQNEIYQKKINDYNFHIEEYKKLLNKF